MIIANLATYPPRRDNITKVIDAIAPQVDRLNIVLNEYNEIPDQFTAHDNVSCIIPPFDTKDTGKFFPDVSAARYVVLIDDDITYPPDYVKKSIESLESLGPGKFAGGYHCSTYIRPPLELSVKGIKSLLRFFISPSHIARFRKIHHIALTIDRPIIVDQIGTGTAILRSRDFPSFDYMKTSQKFVDVRLARWFLENEITPACLPHEASWMKETPFDETIVTGFTSRHHQHVAKEIWSFAFKRPNLGEALPKHPS